MKNIIKSLRILNMLLSIVMWFLVGLELFDVIDWPLGYLLIPPVAKIVLAVITITITAILARRDRAETDTIVITIRLDLLDIDEPDRTDFTDGISQEIQRYIIEHLFPDKQHILGYGLSYGERHPANLSDLVSAIQEDDDNNEL